MTFKNGDRVRYVGTASPDLSLREGTIVCQVGANSVEVQFDGAVQTRSVFTRNLLPVMGSSKPSPPGGMKYDGGKPRMALLLDGCPNALEAVAQVLTFGAQKYAAHSWQTVPEGEERYKSALLRHLTAVGKGEEFDSESNLHHLAHAACNALFILELELRKHK